ncbi:TadE/TadG family type IV pilus assembly protein [Anaerobium acetethylicum]|uniref:TadE-like protein n=1 Tax=Anaerobium acetethylicum TaxID=1619234 RepID=A0A1D3TRL3_9FIRM|nr:hypothetical protein [Anaerobium acetethylicum]SCP96361.1 hypothetical protein SAMN05421730_1004132 [Anaerobium acetethylicum]
MSLHKGPVKEKIAKKVLRNRNYQPYKKNMQDSLRTHLIPFTPMNGYIGNKKVRTSLFTPFTGGGEAKQSCRGSLTVEAACALPLFLFAMFTIMYFMEIMRLQTDIGSVLCQTGREMAEYGYAVEHAAGLGTEQGKAGGIAASVMGDIYVKNRIVSELGKDYLNSSCIVGGSSGISLARSVFMGESDEIDLIAEYEIRLPFFSFGVPGIPVVQRARVRAWTGYEGGSGNAGSREEIVYITRTGTVYHRNPACTHLKLSIRQVPESGIADMRNADGSRYLSCEICKKKVRIPGMVYITDQGDCYHLSLDCSGLKRGIIAIPISEVGGRRPCSRCGG